MAARILLSPGKTDIADAQTQYSNWAANTVLAALVILRDTATDGTKTTPCLACIHCPTVLRRGHTVDSPWDKTDLLPGFCPTFLLLYDLKSVSVLTRRTSGYTVPIMDSCFNESISTLHSSGNKLSLMGQRQIQWLHEWIGLFLICKASLEKHLYIRKLALQIMPILLSTRVWTRFLCQSITTDP